MREIKFRAWSKREKKMYPVFTPFHKDKSIMQQTDLPLHIAPWKMFTIMQYTGLKDKNDKEIYEGDILGWTKKGDGDNRHEVFWDSGCWMTKSIYKIPPGSDELYKWVMAGVTSIEVIGNIYENPELLKL